MIRPPAGVTGQGTSGALAGPISTTRSALVYSRKNLRLRPEKESARRLANARRVNAYATLYSRRPSGQVPGPRLLSHRYTLVRASYQPPPASVGGQMQCHSFADREDARK